MSVYEHEPRNIGKRGMPVNLNRQADLAVANHAGEISVPLSRLNTEAATIDIGNNLPDRWDENGPALPPLFRAKPQRFEAEIRKRKTNSESIVNQEGPYCLIGEHLEQLCNSAKAVYAKEGKNKEERTSRIKNMLEANKEGLGKALSALSTVFDVSAKSSPQVPQAGAAGED